VTAASAASKPAATAARKVERDGGYGARIGLLLKLRSCPKSYANTASTCIGSEGRLCSAHAPHRRHPQ
jgi:hypothetical protein